MREEKKWIVYRHTNKINGKVYIGITSKNPKARWLNGLGYQRNYHFYRAIKEYGWDNFRHEVIISGLSLNDAANKERELIEHYQSDNKNNGYNRTSGGIIGAMLSEESRKIMSLSRVGEKNHRFGIIPSIETRLKLSLALKGRRLSKETKDKLSSAHKGKQAGNKHPMYGKHHTEETKLKISETRKTRYCGKDNYWYGKNLPEELKVKMSLAKKGKHLRGDGSYAKKIICLQTGELFMCIIDAAEKYGIKPGTISNFFIGRQKTAGKHPETGEKLRWMYYEDYLKQKNA